MLFERKLVKIINHIGETAKNMFKNLLNIDRLLDLLLTRDPRSVEFSRLEMSGDEIFCLKFAARKSGPAVGRSHDHDGQGDQTDD